mgnify:CR=1 FL=1
MFFSHAKNPKKYITYMVTTDDLMLCFVWLLNTISTLQGLSADSIGGSLSLGAASRGSVMTTSSAPISIGNTPASHMSSLHSISEVGSLRGRSAMTHDAFGMTPTSIGNTH